jgi:hypothetical protein
MIPLAASGGHGETIAFFVIGVLGMAISAAVFLVPGIFDAATRMRLRMQSLDEDDEHTLERDRARRRFIALVLGIGSTVILMQGLARL